VYLDVQVISRRTAKNAAATQTKSKLNPRQPNTIVRQRPDWDASYRGPSLSAWYRRDGLTRTSGTAARCQSLSPTRQLALENLKAEDRLGPSLSAWYRRDGLTRTSGTAARRQSLSPTRQLALENLKAEDRLDAREYEAIKSLTRCGTSGNRTSRQVNETRSVFDIERLARRADKRRDEVALHLLSHEPNSPLFRAALSPMLTTYQLAPRLS